MSPLLQPGDEVLLDPRAYRRCRPNPGDIVVAQHPYYLDTKIIKRVQSLTDDGGCHLVGDNPSESSDSRTLGSFSIEQILGRVTSKLA